jgi:hypothetical protein
MLPSIVLWIQTYLSQGWPYAYPVTEKKRIEEDDDADYRSSI